MKTLRGQVTVSAPSHLAFLLPFSCVFRSLRRREGKEGFGISRSMDLCDCCLWGREGRYSVNFVPFSFFASQIPIHHAVTKPQNTAHPHSNRLEAKQNDTCLCRLQCIGTSPRTYGNFSQCHSQIITPPNFRHSQTKPNSQGPHGERERVGEAETRSARSKKRAKKIKKKKERK